MSRTVIWPARLYTVFVLIAAAFFLSPSLSFIPVLVAAIYIFLWRWPSNYTLKLFFEQFSFFAVSILLAPTLGTWLSIVVSLPVLLAVTASLADAETTIPWQKNARKRQPTRILTCLVLTAVLTICLAAFLGSLATMLAGATFILYLCVLLIIILRKMPVKPIEENPINQRMIAGTYDSLTSNLTVTTNIGGTLFIESPYTWVKVETGLVPLKNNKIAIGISLNPPLSGPATIQLDGYARDRWGLIQNRFQISPINLFVIPRAKYAEWLVKKYIASTRTGTLSLISNISNVRPTYGLRQGIEYYGSRLYQPGDSLKDIDWKHSIKYNELVSKEFADLHGQPALVLINLAVRDEEEADILAYNIMSTAMSLVAENITAVLTSYDQETVRETTPMLRDERLLTTSIEIARGITMIKDPNRYMNLPDVRRLKANMSSIRYIKGKAAEVLYDIMNLEYHSMQENAKANPLTKALTAGLKIAGSQVNILVISRQNHDAEALSFNIFDVTSKGYNIIVV